MIDLKKSYFTAIVCLASGTAIYGLVKHNQSTVVLPGTDHLEMTDETTLSEYTYLHFNVLRGVSPQVTLIGNTSFEGIPEDVYALDNCQVIIEGFADPLVFHEDQTLKKLILFRHLADCCFGGVPQRNEWVLVNLVGKPPPTSLRKGDGVAVMGTLRVRQHDKTDERAPLYELDADYIEILFPF